MGFSTFLWIFVVLSCVLWPNPSAAATFSENFSRYSASTCLADLATADSWTSAFNGYGCNKFVAVNGDIVAFERPQISTFSEDTHASLILGPSFQGDIVFETNVFTAQQIRQGSPANAWEVAWVLWNYEDNVHFYYFIAKPNGWELGKEDPAYKGAQRFLIQGTSPTFAIRTWYKIRIEQTGTTIRVFVDDNLITTFTDTERPYTSGKIGLYNEDSEVYFDNISVNQGAVPPSDTVITAESVRVYPNPWRRDRPTATITFDTLPANTTLKLFTISGYAVKTLSGTGRIDWDLTNESGEKVASGLYLYVISADGSTNRGKLSIIR